MNLTEDEDEEKEEQFGQIEASYLVFGALSALSAVVVGMSR